MSQKVQAIPMIMVTASMPDAAANIFGYNMSGKTKGGKPKKFYLVLQKKYIKNIVIL